jgi:hypothetical protein
VAEDVRDFGLAEAGGVVLEGDLKFRLVDLKAAEAVGVGEFAERAELIVRERGLEFEFGLEECHGGIIAKSGWRTGRKSRGLDGASWCSWPKSKRDFCLRKPTDSQEPTGKRMRCLSAFEMAGVVDVPELQRKSGVWPPQ